MATTKRDPIVVVPLYCCSTEPSTLVSAALDIPSSSSSTGGRSYSPNATTSNTSLAKRFLPAPNSFPMDTYSRKVFIGGLPPDIDEGIQGSCSIFKATSHSVIHFERALYSISVHAPSWIAFNTKHIIMYFMHAYMIELAGA